MNKLNHLNYYRLPWNLTDNSISWLEPTSKCNLYCEGCYRNNVNNSHKSLDEVRAELEVFIKFRKCDGVSIAGGEPLTHPDIVKIVSMVKSMGMKPIINTNGELLTMELLMELKKAGVYGFTFHIDSKQRRKGWMGKNEAELNELRLHYAKMLKEAGNISCSFNSTVYQDTMKYIPELARWAQENIDIVQVMVFIIYRAVENERVDFYSRTSLIDMKNLVYKEHQTDRTDIKAEEVWQLIKDTDTEFDSCAYLNGSEQPDSFKWLLTGRLGNKRRIYGYLGHKAMEIVQTFHHLFKGRYLAYSKPNMTRKGKSLLLLSVFDKKLRKAFWNFYKNPLNIFRRLHYQSIMIIQPIDFLDDGRQNMCDGCPDITVWNGKLVWSCRMEEQINYGRNLITYPKETINN